MESILVVKTRCPVLDASTHSSSSPKFPQRLWLKILLLPNLTSFVIFNCRCHCRGDKPRSMASPWHDPLTNSGAGGAFLGRVRRWRVAAESLGDAR